MPVDSGGSDAAAEESIKECLARLGDAETVLADVRSILAAIYGEKPQEEASPRGSEVEANSQESVEDAKQEAEEEVIKEELEKQNALIDARAQIPEIAQRLSLTKEKVESVFEMFTQANHTRSGFLSLDELEGLLAGMCDGTIGSDQLNFIMDKFDHNKDGKLHFDEFINAFVSTPLMKVAHLHEDLQNKAGGAREQIEEAGIRLQPEDWVQIMGCKVTTVKNYVQKEINEAGACLAMPLVFLMFLLFYISSVYHLDYEKLHAVDQAVYFDITENANFAFGGDIPLENGRMGHKNIFDVNSIADFWSFFELGITPIYWAEGWDISETRLNIQTRCFTSKQALENYGWPGATVDGVAQAIGRQPGGNDCPQEIDPQRPIPFYAGQQDGTYLYYNSVVAGVRLRQERSDVEDCPNDDSSLLSALFKGLCVADEGYFLRPELHAALRTDTSLVNRPGGATIYLPSLISQREIRKQVQQLENEVWLSPYTAKVEILLTTYNAHLDVFTATYIWIFFNRGGHMYKVVQPISTFLTVYRYSLCYALDVILVLLCIKIIIDECREIYGYVRIEGFRKGMKLYIAPSNFIDWLSVFYFIFMMIFWFGHIAIIYDLQDAMKKGDSTQ